MYSTAQCGIGLGRPPRLDWLERLPKVELHLHLEGAIPHATLWELICKYGGDSAVPDQAALPGRFVYRDFPDFIDRWIWKQGFLREAADYELIGAAVARDLVRQRIVYAEAFYSPVDVGHAGRRSRRHRWPCGVGSLLYRAPRSRSSQTSSVTRGPSGPCGRSRPSPRSRPRPA